jgi:hypothetical protein
MAAEAQNLGEMHTVQDTFVPQCQTATRYGPRWIDLTTPPRKTQQEAEAEVRSYLAVPGNEATPFRVIRRVTQEMVVRDQWS